MQGRHYYRVYDSMNLHLTSTLKKILADLLQKSFMVEHRNMLYHDQIGGSDCGLSAIASVCSLCKGHYTRGNFEATLLPATVAGNRLIGVCLNIAWQIVVANLLPGIGPWSIFRQQLPETSELLNHKSSDVIFSV